MLSNFARDITVTSGLFRSCVRSQSAGNGDPNLPASGGEIVADFRNWNLDLPALHCNLYLAVQVQCMQIQTAIPKVGADRPASCLQVGIVQQ